MVNNVLNAVTKQLGTTFGSSYRIYVEDVEQSLQTPCFTVNTLMPLQRAKSPVLYDRTFPIVIHYFSDSESDIKKDCYAMGEQILECLEYLPFGTTILRGKNTSYQVVDGVLQVFVTYEFVTKRVTETTDNMESVVEQVTHTQ